MILLIQRVLILLGSVSHSITEKCQRVAWARVDPKSSLPGNKEKDTTFFCGGFWRKLPNSWKRRKPWQRSQGVHLAINNHRPSDNDKIRIRMISVVFLEKSAPAKYRSRNQRHPKP